jgi:RNA polymerase sigma-70 factor (ECF subfamily)
VFSDLPGKAAEHQAVSCVSQNPDGAGDSLEADLQAVATRRDRLAFQRLFAFYAPKIKACFDALGAAEKDAEQLMQDVMLTIWHRAGELERDQMAPATWIFTLVRNQAVATLRRGGRPDLDLDDPELVRETYKTPDGSTETGPEPMKRTVLPGIERLSSEDLNLLRNYYFEEQGDIAQASSQLRLVLERLRSVLDGADG